ncbi:phosphoribosylglycinamide synthetase [Algimonas porphyrae]|uniref:ATP-grasp domain-containing protein n=1 Tax=Algimonas porphyrae TaxID=1128113 RepID=A0ABQ5UZK4_9PROT|nr:hypothetical protein [Algimonas porphyrae]GLQ19402.1 hypothetical protein GCM10007854_03570 [Algimonas porphyrae]
MDLRLKLTDADRHRLKVMFLAKHALGDGSMDSEDGLHAVYHHELRQVLEQIVPNLSVGSRYSDLFAQPDYDFLFTMLNRGGFKNSEMFGPLFSVWRDVPHLGASPILRGVGDDKHLTKLCARARGVTTPDSAIYRYGGVPQDPQPFADGPMMVKPNASSASWGVKKCADWADAKAHMAELMAEDDRHDVIVERFVDGIEMAVPVVPGADGMPAFLPVMIYDGEDLRLRTYQEKRFRESNTEWRVCDDSRLSDHILADVQKLMPEIWPFDFGRFEFKYVPETGAFSFIELNMSCNLWSKKTVASSWRSLGHSHAELIETILTGSLLRQGVITEYVRGAES